MSNLPTISIVVPSFNQGQYLRETLQSLVDQEYPALEVIIQDGGSRDDSVAIAQEFVQAYPGVFRLFAEKDDGQADALNRGFRRATGTILGFLNSDDTLYPRVLHSVAREIDPSRDRHVVMGRSLFTGVNSRYVGVEHPAEYISHFEHLAIWKRGYNTIPQPSVFWHKEVSERCGLLDVNEHHALDYDLFCRFSRHYWIHKVDELWSTYRMHDESKSAQRTEAEVLELSIGVSRKHWGSWLSPLRWRCELSHWAYRKHFSDHARHHARRAEQAFRQRKLLSAMWELLMTTLYSPKMARDRLVYGWLSQRVPGLLRKVVTRDTSFHGQHNDGWIGPSFIAQLEIPGDAQTLQYRLEHVPQVRHDRFEVQLLVEGTVADRRLLDDPGQFRLAADVSGLQGQRVHVEIKSGSYFIPREIMGLDDNRELSIKLNEVRFDHI
ncbi:glycosyltransferase family 2 protein [Lysobacter sp. TAF61]|uniref:glycosyltransferase family 2 protein n=1 Tax=Lysobacter sp. TAF61 TaxID=3233072 RepID=UPI003F9B4A07